MKKFRDLNTYFKLLIFIISTSILVLVLYCSLYVYTLKHEDQAFTNTQKQYYNEASSIIQLNSKTQVSILVDYTCWDELKYFTKSKDINWFNTQIVNEFIFYQVDYIGVYDIEGQFIIKTSNAKINTKNFISKEVIRRLHELRVMHFYMKIPEGIVEIFGATIHPSNESKKNITKPSGYFFMVRLLDQNYCKNLDYISSSKVSLSQSIKKQIFNNEFLEAKVLLKDYKNAPLVNLVFKRTFNLHYENTKEILIILILVSLINLGVFFYFSRSWIYKPLKIITNVLETGNESAINDLKNEPGEFKYIGNLFEEISNQKKQLELSKKKAEESDKLKSSFLANLSHEIRTPMNAIVGFSDLLKDSNISEEVRNEYLKIIKNCGSNLVSIIEDLIEMSKIDAKQITPNIKSINLDACLQELYKTILVTIPYDKEIELILIENEKKIQKNILTDEIKLTQVIVNLISNAIKYTEKGKVTFGYQVNEQNDTIVFTVKDTGLGIGEENLKIIFDRFRRIEDEFSVALSGLGLGLSISKAYIEMLGGTISVSSQIKVGSIFTFTIPLKYGEKIEVITQVDRFNDVFESNFKTVLIAEDDNINFLLLKTILELKKCTVLRAANGQEAVDICRKNSDIDLVFMDIKMPVMNGFQAFKLINSVNPRLPVIAQTAYSSAEDYEKIINAGFLGCISKPLDRNKIYELIDAVFK